MDYDKLNVAIVGGGIAGVTLALSLQHRGIACKVYEKTPAVAHNDGILQISPETARAMKLCAPGVAAAYKETGNTVSLGTKDGGVPHVDIIRDGIETRLRFHYPNGTSTHSRRDLLQRLVGRLAKDTFVFGKRIMEISPSPSGRLILEAIDNHGMHSSEPADVVVGCDGIFSRVRSHVVGKVHPSSWTRFSHQIVYDLLVPMDKAVSALGERIAMSATCQFFPSDDTRGSTGSCIYLKPVVNGTYVNLTAVFTEKASSENENSVHVFAKPTEMLEKAKDWGPSNISSLVRNEGEYCVKWAIFDSAAAPPYTVVQGRAVIIGDAAHAATNHLGFNACTAFEDVLILAEVLADKRLETDPKRLEAALGVYERMRLDRGRELVNANRDAGKLVMLASDDLNDLEQRYNAILSLAHAWQADAALAEVQKELNRLLKS